MNIKTLSKNSKHGFHLLAGINREIKPSHVSQMAQSIQHFKNVVRPVLVAVIDFLPGGKKTYIIDGQHLYTACLRLKIDIPYEVINHGVGNIAELIESIALLNTTSKSWTLEDFISTWAYYKPNYQRFIELFNLYNIERLTLAELLHTGVVTAKNHGNHSITKVIKAGNLRIINEKLAIEVLDYVTDLRSITKDLGRIEQKLIISAIIEKIKADGKAYNHNAYKQYLQKNREKLILASNDIDTLRALINK